MTAALLVAASRVVSGPTVQWRCDADAVRQRIYFANHTSHLDFVAIWSSLPRRLRRLTRPVAGCDYWMKTCIRRYLADRVFRAVLIERHSRQGNPAAARASIERLAREMGRAHSLIVFPEGTRTSGGELAPFKSGLYHLARLRPDAELIPVYLENLDRILPKGEALPVPMLSRVVFGPPLDARSDMRDLERDKQQFLSAAREALLRLRRQP